MKLKMKDIGKGLAAIGTLVGGTILAFQTKKSLRDQEYDSTLEPLGESPEIEPEHEVTEPEETEVEES